jgi:hypothetical protein
MNDVLKIDVPSTTQFDVVYTLVIDKKNKKLSCSCPGFSIHGYCKHSRMYKPIISKVLYGSDFVEKVINSFNNCYDFVNNLCSVYPECIGDYDKLDYYAKVVLDGVGRHYKTETIHRSYRLLVANGEIVEPSNVVNRKERTEHVMSDINRWSSKRFVCGFNGQTNLL